VWGTQDGDADNIVWGTACRDADCDNIVWGTSGDVQSIVWGSSSEEDNITWGCNGEDAVLFDDPDVPSVFDGTVDLDGAFGTGGDVPVNGTQLLVEPPPAVLPTNNIVLGGTF